MSNNNKSYYYHVIPGDKTSTKITITKEQLYEIELKLSDTVSNNYRNDIHTKRAQRDAATLISVSYHCLGGNDPCHRSKLSQSDRRSMLIPNKLRSVYISYFIEEIVKAFYTFDRSKGCWTQYVGWVKGKAIRSTIRYEQRENRQLSLINTANDYANLYGYFLLLGDTALESVEFYSHAEEEANEELNKDINNMDGDVVTN